MYASLSPDGEAAFLALDTALNSIQLNSNVQMLTQLQGALIFICVVLVLSRFYQNLQSSMSTEKLHKLQIPDPPISQELQDPSHRLETENWGEEEKEEKNKTTVYKRRRKRERHHQTDCCHGDESSSVPGLDDCWDLFT